MIEYEGNAGVLGSLHDLNRVHGSAAYKVVLPASFSTLFLLGLYYLEGSAGRKTIFTIYHPYAVGALIIFFSFLLTSRLNSCLNRYWEGASSVHLMLSKWMDCAMCIGAFHYQSDQFKDIAPPTFGAISNIQQKEVCGRHRDFPWLSSAETKRKSSLNEASVLKRAAFVNTKNDAASLHEARELVYQGKNIYSDGDIESQHHDHSGTIPIPIRFQDQFLAFSTDEESHSLESSREESEKRQHLLLHRKARGSRTVTKTLRSKMPTPSLFMQEAAHLMSLLSAVALSTLRNDVDQTASPVVPYFPNSPWPAVDPDCLPEKVKGKYGEANAFWRVTYFCLGLSRSKKRRTLYNAARPFGVLGGVSDEEIRLLQEARGPYAKVALVTLWLQEYLSREYLAGSTGKVHPPIISRLYQLISDGMLGYNQARKIAYIPFPFPNGQITAFFSFAVIFVFPFLYGGFVTKLWFSCIMNFLTVLCFLGLHEVARELENPFRNVPNDLPLLTYQAQFNEALVTLYAGFHPDSWWEIVPQRDLALVNEEDDF